MLPITVKSNDLFSPLDNRRSSPCFITFSSCVTIYLLQATFLHLLNGMYNYRFQTAFEYKPFKRHCSGRVSELACPELPGKEPHKLVRVDSVIASGNLSSVMVSILTPG